VPTAISKISATATCGSVPNRRVGAVTMTEQLAGSPAPSPRRSPGCSRWPCPPGTSRSWWRTPCGCSPGRSGRPTTSSPGTPFRNCGYPVAGTPMVVRMGRATRSTRWKTAGHAESYTRPGGILTTCAVTVKDDAQHEPKRLKEDVERQAELLKGAGRARRRTAGPETHAGRGSATGVDPAGTI
jgi:hypothetical protein